MFRDIGYTQFGPVERRGARPSTILLLLNGLSVLGVARRPKRADRTARSSSTDRSSGDKQVLSPAVGTNSSGRLHAETFRLCALALGATLLAPIHADADRLPLGLDIGGSGSSCRKSGRPARPHLCVANSSRNEQTLVLSRWRSRAMPARPCCAGE